MPNQTTVLTCLCQQVSLQVQGKPILSAECLCSDCQSAGAALQRLPGAPSILDSNSATRFVLYRKDRVRCTKGREHLREHRLSVGSSTRRVVAACCNTPMFLEFAKGHWLSIYARLWPTESLPRLELRTMTRSRPKGVVLANDVPNPATHTFSFFAKLLCAWAAMGFRTPKIDWVSGDINAQQ